MSSYTERLDDLLSNAVTNGATPGAVAIVADADSVIYKGASGVRSVDTAVPMTLDSMFRIASMTKLLTSTVMLKLIEEGRATLDTPVGDILPAFDRLQVLDGFDGDRPLMRAARTRATLRHLFTHTAGLGYDTWSPALFRYQQLTGVPGVGAGLRSTFGLPLVSEPGTAFDYGTASDWMGLVVEELTGAPLDAVWRSQITGPLGLDDIVAAMSPEQAARSADVHQRADDGRWLVSPADNAQDPEFYAGGHCLYSSATDFVVLQQMLLNHGVAGGGHRLLAYETTEDMFRAHSAGVRLRTLPTAIPEFSYELALDAGDSWGLGLMLSTSGTPGGRAAGSAGWMGVYNTFFWVDRERGRTAALYTQTLPFLDPAVMTLYRDFEQAVYASLD